LSFISKTLQVESTSSKTINQMTSKQLFARGLIILIGLTLLAHSAHSHEAFYPHHRDDLDSVRRRNELRVTVLILTVGFISVLGGVVYVALRKSREIDSAVSETEQARLERAASEAANAGRAVLVEQGTSAQAIRAALAAYAAGCGAVWNQSSVVVSGESIRCRIGSDVVVVNIRAQADRYEIEVNAACDEAKARSAAGITKT
ncbi:MAG: hypothetical protein O7E52_06845, partial [Candidatus Poribacteria bacterium]|nr:hypothetical protein [Candidatus Poribacteria bacterium]